MGQTTFSGPVASQNGFIENSFTTAERDAIVNPTAGLLIYNTTTNTYEVYNGTGWQAAFGPPVPTVETWGTTSWPSDHTVQSFVLHGSGMSGQLTTFSVDLTGYESNTAALLALPIDTVFTITQASMMPSGGTFTLTTQFALDGGVYTAQALYVGGAYMTGMSTVGQCSVA